MQAACSITMDRKYKKDAAKRNWTLSSIAYGQSGLGLGLVPAASTEIVSALPVTRLSNEVWDVKWLNNLLID